MQDDPPFSSVKYNDDFRDRTDAQRFASMRLSRDAQTIGNAWNGLEGDTAVWAGKKR